MAIKDRRGNLLKNGDDVLIPAKVVRVYEPKTPDGARDFTRDDVDVELAVADDTKGKVHLSLKSRQLDLAGAVNAPEPAAVGPEPTP